MNKPRYKNTYGDFYSNGVFIPKDDILTLHGIYLGVQTQSWVDLITSFGFKITLSDNLVKERLKLII